MKTIQKTETVTKTLYEADDGKLYPSEALAIAHNQALVIQQENERIAKIREGVVRLPSPDDEYDTLGDILIVFTQEQADTYYDIPRPGAWVEEKYYDRCGDRSYRYTELVPTLDYFRKIVTKLEEAQKIFEEGSHE